MIFVKSASSAAALVFDLPLCTHTDTDRGQSPEYILKSSKNTIFNEQPVCYVSPVRGFLFVAGSLENYRLLCTY